MMLFALFLLFSVSYALESSKKPAENFDLSHWKLTLPDPKTSSIWPPELFAGYTSQYFKTARDGAMSFYVKGNGGTTEGSNYPRSELRELLEPGDDSVNWGWKGVHTLTAQCKVVSVGPKNKKVIIGQIHGFEDRALIKLLFSTDSVIAQCKNFPDGGPNNDETKLEWPGIPVGSVIDYVIQVDNGVLYITVNSVKKSFNFVLKSSSWKKVTYYFKAGAYLMSTVSTDSATVNFYSLKVTHSSTSANAVDGSTEAGLSESDDENISVNRKVVGISVAIVGWIIIGFVVVVVLKNRESESKVALLP